MWAWDEQVKPGSAVFAALLIGAAGVLVGGDLNDDGVVDIIDLGLFVFEFGQDYGDPSTGDTDCDTPPPHADISGSGVVFTDDFVFISGNFLQVDQTCPQSLAAGSGHGATETPKPLRRIPVAELHRRGLGHLEVADINGDGWLGEQDIVLFLQEVTGSE